MKSGMMQMNWSPFALSEFKRICKYFNYKLPVYLGTQAVLVNYVAEIDPHNFLN